MAIEIGVVGTFIRDTIITLDGRKIESIGGLYHTSAYLASLSVPGTVIRPLCQLGRDFYDAVQRALQAFGAEVRFDAVYPHAQNNTAVTLIYRSAETRDEITTPPMPPITAAHMRGLSGCDAVLVNLITGDDLELEALQDFARQSPSTLIYLDFHSLALGIDEQGRRFYRRPPSWQNWLSAVGILQLNEREAATLAGWKTNPREADFIEFGTQVVGEYVQACHLTFGSRGSILFYRSANGIRHEYVSPLTGMPTVDIIGCGDAFGAAFLIRFLVTGDYVQAARFANRLAGLNCTFMGSLTPEKFQKYVTPFLP